jgi:ketosteroid isomerase-like protein
MAHPNADLIRTATDKLNAGDFEGFLAMHADNVTIHVTGRNKLAGHFKGKKEAADSLQQLAGELDGPPSFETHDILASDDHAVALGVQKATRGGKTLTSETVVVAHVKDGKFTEVWVTTNDPYAEDEFFA